MAVGVGLSDLVNMFTLYIRHLESKQNKKKQMQRCRSREAKRVEKQKKSLLCVSEGT